MDSRTLIKAYMNAKNYDQYKQMAADLNLSQSHLAEINRGKKEFVDETAIYIAGECGLDPEEVVMSLAAARARTPHAKDVWAKVLKRYCAGAEAAVCAGLLAFFHPLYDFALCILC